MGISSIFPKPRSHSKRHVGCFLPYTRKSWTDEAVESHSLVLALNETRKTLLASRLLIAKGAHGLATTAAENICPGDGVWIEACNSIDTSSVREPLDLLFLDSKHRVVATVPNLGRGARCPEVEEAAGVLEVAAGTIRLSQTEKGDHIVLEAISP